MSTPWSPGADGPATTASSPSPYVDPHTAQRLFAHKVLAFLHRKELISEERLQLISSWKHSGFSVHNAVHVPAGDHSALEALIRYVMRPPVSLARLRLLPEGREVLHFPKGGDDDPGSMPPFLLYSSCLVSAQGRTYIPYSGFSCP